jgi:hypothetical protein
VNSHDDTNTKPNIRPDVNAKISTKININNGANIGAASHGHSVSASLSFGVSVIALVVSHFSGREMAKRLKYRKIRIFFHFPLNPRW